MDVKLLRLTALYSLALMVIVIVISSVMTLNYNAAIATNAAIKQAELSGKEDSSDSDKNSIDKLLGDNYIVIKKTNQKIEHVEIADLYMDKSICVTISEIYKENFNTNSITCVKKRESDIIKAVSIHYSNDKKEQNTTSVTISLDAVYAYVLYQDDKAIYIDLKRPKDVYKKIIVVDAGHGGTDSGTYSKGSQCFEKDINLSILLDLKELLDQEDIKVYYTRTTDKTVFLNPRVNLANEVEADYFLSIHCNADESSKPSGSEVLYNNKSGTNNSPSKQFAQICLEEITSVTHKVHRGLVDGNDMVIIKNATMPVALIEVGFISNRKDLKFLLNEGNRKNIAIAINIIIKRAFKEL